MLKEQARQRPWRFATLFEQVRAQLEDDDGVMTSQRRRRAAQDGELVAVDVELDDIDACQPQLVDRGHPAWTRLRSMARAHPDARGERRPQTRERPAGEIGPGRRVAWGDQRAVDQRHARGQRGIERAVVAQPSHGGVGWFNRDHAAVGAQPAGQRQRLRADVRAHINHDRVRTGEPGERPRGRPLIDAEIERQLDTLVQVEQPSHAVSRAANLRGRLFPAA